jgi:hypothetical protein
MSRNLTQLEPTLFMDIRHIVLIRVRQGSFDPDTKRREAILDLVLDSGRAEGVHLPAGDVGEKRLNAIFENRDPQIHHISE